MKTAIGGALLESRPRLALASLIGTGVIGVDLVLMLVHPDESLAGWRVSLVLAALSAYLILTRGDRASLGLSFIPAQGGIYWCKVTAVLDLIIGSWILSPLIPIVGACSDRSTGLLPPDRTLCGKCRSYFSRSNDRAGGGDSPRASTQW